MYSKSPISKLWRLNLTRLDIFLWYETLKFLIEDPSEMTFLTRNQKMKQMQTNTISLQTSHRRDLFTKNLLRQNWEYLVKLELHCTHWIRTTLHGNFLNNEI